jgi:hypothetical protein
LGIGIRKINTKNVQSSNNKLFSLSFRLWFAAFLLFIFGSTIFATAWLVRQASTEGGYLSQDLSRIIITAADFPSLVKEAFKEVDARLKGYPRPLLLTRKKTQQLHWVRRFPTPEDSGYLLLAGVDSSAKHSIVQLIRISDGTSVARWDPDWEVIYSMITEKKFAPKGSTLSAQAFNPLMLANGDVVFNTGTSLVRQDPCHRQPVWVLDEIMHHSNELDISGTAIWVPSVSRDGFPNNLFLRDRIRDDALALVSIDGQILDKQSFAKILVQNDLRAMFLGMGGDHFNEDPIHMNEIKVAPSDSKYWNRGDLLISARHLSTVFLYRPTIGKILWYKTGPWMNQHSVDFVNDHQISVFDNNIIASVPQEHAFMKFGDTNRVIIYDFDTKLVSQPFAAMLADARPVSITGGVARVLPDGGLYVEETNYGRSLRFSRDRLLWSRVNDYDNQYIGALSWSRYLTKDEVSLPLKALAAKQCNNTK